MLSTSFRKHNKGKERKGLIELQKDLHVEVQLLAIAFLGLFHTSDRRGVVSGVGIGRKF